VTHRPIDDGRIAKPTSSSYSVPRSQDQPRPILFIRFVCRPHMYLSVNVLKMYYSSATEATFNELADMDPLSPSSTCGFSPIRPVLKSGPRITIPEVAKGVSHHYLRVTRFCRNSFSITRRELTTITRVSLLPIVMIELPGNYESNVEVLTQTSTVCDPTFRLSNLDGRRTSSSLTRFIKRHACTVGRHTTVTTPPAS